MFSELKKRKSNKINQKKYEAKTRIKQALNKMKNQFNKLDSFKQNYIEKAKKAYLEGDQSTYNLVKSGLKMCLSKQKFLNQMITHFELTLEISDMNSVVTEFMSGINELSNQLGAITNGVDVAKAQMSYERALANNASQYEALETFLIEANSSIEGMNDNLPQVSDKEIDELISNNASCKEEEIDKEIENRLNSFKERMDIKDE